jgi:glycosyltransferase involved in cell wall biosynthesis
MIKKTLKKKYATTKRILKNDGPIVLSIKALEKLDSKRVRKFRKSKINFLVKHEDVLKADWSKKPPLNLAPIDKKSYTFNWVMSPPGKGSGGHQNLFRFIRYLEKAGHKNRIYLYSTRDRRTINEIKKVLDNSYPKISATIEPLGDEMKPADAIFATGWETAYPVFNSGLSCRRFYFVQDFEPLFYPMGSEYILAENTYRFGFFGITAGGWLAKKLNRDYGMQTAHFDFGADNNLYKLSNAKKRKEIFFYARPVTARRGFELGIMALELFNHKHPEYTINLAGWDVAEYEIPFPHKNLKTLDLKQLPNLYNKCAAGLVMSLTNMSLLPLELLSCGTIPVVNDGENNRLVSDNKFIAYVSNNPVSMADKLSEIVTMKDLPGYAAQASKSVQAQSWDISGKKFASIVESELRRG